MPVIRPRGGDVSWPQDEAAIGVVGVAPWATVDFCAALYGLVDAKKDWHYPRVLVDANSKIPSRGRHLELGEDDPSPAIRATIDELAAQGAAVVAVPCNTAHLLFERWASGAAAAVPNAIALTASAARQRGARRAAVLSSRLLAEKRLYQHALEAEGTATMEIDADLQTLVGELIARVKVNGGAGTAEQQRLRALLEAAQARGADFAILGCTELSAVGAASERALPLPVVDSNQELARACLARIGIVSQRDRFNRA